MDRVTLMFLAAFVASIVGMLGATVGAQVTGAPLDTLQARPQWRQLPRPFLVSLAARLQSSGNARAFADFAETSGLLERNIRQIALDSTHEPDDAVGLVAVTLTSYGMSAVRGNDLRIAKRALEFAVLIRPRHVAAWQGMALVAWGLKNCPTAVTWADKVLTFKPDPASNDFLERGQALAMTPEGERFLESQGMGKVGQWQDTLKLMETVKRECRA